MIRSGFFNSINGDRKYDSGFFADYFASFIGNGVFPNPSTNLQVMANDNMTITVKAGTAWINGYILFNDNDHVLNVSVADGVLNRIDRIVLRFDTVGRDIQLIVKQGEFATVPVAPVLQRDADGYELALADVYISRGSITITQTDIIDTRLNNELCGVVSGVVEQVDVTTLFNQYNQGFELKKEEFEQEFNSWFNNLQDLLDENTASNLLNLINDVENDLGSHKADDATDAHLPKNVGLGNVTNDKQMPISGGVLENYREKLTTVSASGGSINLSLGNIFVHSPSENITYSITNAISGQAHSFTLMVTQAATVRTLTFPASVIWQGGEIPDMSTATKTYVLTFVSVDGGSTWLGMFGGEF